MPIVKVKAKRKVGKNEAPPKRGTIPVCDFRALNSSKSLFFFDIMTMRGMMTHPVPTDNKNAAIMKNSISIMSGSGG